MRTVLEGAGNETESSDGNENETSSGNGIEVGDETAANESSESETPADTGDGTLGNVTVNGEPVSVQSRDGRFVGRVHVSRTDSLTVTGESSAEQIRAEFSATDGPIAAETVTADDSFTLTLEGIEDVDDGELTVSVGSEPETDPVASRTTTVVLIDETDDDDIGAGEVRFFGSDRANSGDYAPAVQIRDDPAAAWVFDTGERVTSRPAIVDGTVYVSTDSERLYAVDASTGTLEWSFDSGLEEEEKHISGSPTVVDGTVYVAYGQWMHENDDDDATGLVTALDAETGDQLWETAGFDDRFTTSPALSPDGETLYVGTWSGGPYALDTDTGTIRWTYEDPDDGTTGGVDRTVPAVTDGSVFIAEEGNGVSRLDEATGALEWQTDLKGSIRSSPAVVDGTVYVGTTDDSLHALDAATGDQEWEYETDGSVTCSPSVADGTVYVGTRGNTLHAVDAAAGTREWTFEVGPPDEVDWITGKPAVVDETVYVGAWHHTHGVYGLDARTGAELWAFEAEGAVRAGPVPTVDAVYVGANSGGLYALTPDRE